MNVNNTGGVRIAKQWDVQRSKSKSSAPLPTTPQVPGSILSLARLRGLLQLSNSNEQYCSTIVYCSFYSAKSHQQNQKKLLKKGRTKQLCLITTEFYRSEYFCFVSALVVDLHCLSGSLGLHVQRLQQFQYQAPYIFQFNCK